MALPGDPNTSDDDLPRRELDELRHSLLPLYIAAQLAVVWAWGFYLAYRNVERWPLDAAAATILLCSLAAFHLRKRHHTLACWLTVLGLVAAEALIVAARPTALTTAFAGLAVIVAYALLDAWQALAVAGLAWVAQAAAWRLSMGAGMPADVAAEAGALYLATWGAVWIGGRPLRRSVQIALSGWLQLRSSLAETRARRAELYRAVRALDEATYRIQHANNQLLVAREAAEAARANKARFAAVVSHELRGPLNLILGFSRLVALSPESYGVELPRAYRADVDAIYENSRHLVSLLDDILDLSQVEVDRMPLVKDRVDVEGQVIPDVVGTVQPLAARKDLYLRLELVGGLPTVLADRTRLRQVLLNLLTNAVRFTQRGGITVSTEAAADGLLVTVADTGPGIPADELPRLFEEFYRLRALEDAGVKGTGLGLAISKHIVELHGGRMWAESTLGSGTAFHFTLPWPQRPAPRAPIGGSRGIEQAPGWQPTCLVVHESPLVSRMLARRIGGYRVVGVSDVAQLVPLVRELLPRAVIAPNYLGEAVTSRLAAAGHAIPVLTCEMQPLGEGRVEGALMYVIKPVAPEAIEAAMRQVQRDGETTVLLVDDDRDAVRLLEKMLRSLPRPYRILKAYGGRQALEAMRGARPDIVFLDLLMPGMSGEQVVAEMREDPALEQVPVVVVSAGQADGTPALLGGSLKLQLERPLDLARGARLIKEMLDALEE